MQVSREPVRAFAPVNPQEMENPSDGESPQPVLQNAGLYP